MKTIDITGKNYTGKWTNTRTACRGLVIDGSKILLSYENVTDKYMIPGGGVEGDESYSECCIREIAEETGKVVTTSECLLEINEYYLDWKFTNKYFICKAVGDTETKRTPDETKVDMRPKWLSIDEIKSIFSEYADYADTDDTRSGMYLREYTALKELL